MYFALETFISKYVLSALLLINTLKVSKTVYALTLLITDLYLKEKKN